MAGSTTSQSRLEHLLVRADWPEATLPDYAGGSIANLPASILLGMGIHRSRMQPPMLRSLRPELLPLSLIHNARVVIMLVIDGLGVENLAWANQQGAVEFLAGSQWRSQITSVFPSTTAAALTTLQTGVAPAGHGIAGYTLYLEEQAATVNVVGWKSVGGVELAKSLPEPVGFSGVQTIYSRLDAAGIETAVVANHEFSGSTLTNIHSPGVTYYGHRTPAELAGMLLRETQRPGRRFIYGYWDGFDALSHTWGPENDVALNELYVLDQALGRGLLTPLAAAGGDVVLVVVADHGHIGIDQDQVVSLKEHLASFGGERPIPTGDRRATGLSNASSAARAHLAEVAGDGGVILPVQDAVRAGLYGPGKPHPELLSRIGETLLLSRGNAAFVFPQSNNVTAGGHGSLTSREMLVPLLGWRF